MEKRKENWFLFKFITFPIQLQRFSDFQYFSMSVQRFSAGWETKSGDGERQKSLKVSMKLTLSGCVYHRNNNHLYQQPATDATEAGYCQRLPFSLYLSSPANSYLMWDKQILMRKSSWIADGRRKIKFIVLFFHPLNVLCDGFQEGWVWQQLKDNKMLNSGDTPSKLHRILPFKREELMKRWHSNE